MTRPGRRDREPGTAAMPDDETGPDAALGRTARAPHPGVLDRREAIRRATLILGGVSLVGGSGLLSACESAERPGAGSRAPIGDFTVRDQDLLDEIAETILPETDTPGAKAAAVGPFMALMVTDVYAPREQEAFRAGMLRIQEEMESRHGTDFLGSEPAQRLALLEELDQAQLDYVPPPPSAGEDASPPHFFRMMKQLALLGYFTSEIGATMALRYVESPGRYEPCVPYEPGERDWAGHA